MYEEDEEPQKKKKQKKQHGVRYTRPRPTHLSLSHSSPESTGRKQRIWVTGQSDAEPNNQRNQDNQVQNDLKTIFHRPIHGWTFNTNMTYK